MTSWIPVKLSDRLKTGLLSVEEEQAATYLTAQLNHVTSCEPIRSLRFPYCYSSTLPIVTWLAMGQSDRLVSPTGKTSHHLSGGTASSDVSHETRSGLVTWPAVSQSDRFVSLTEGSITKLHTVHSVSFLRTVKLHLCSCLIGDSFALFCCHNVAEHLIIDIFVQFLPF